MTSRHYISLADVFAQIRETIEFDDIDLVDTNQRSRSDEYPINIAAHWGDIDAMRILLAHGADINALGERGMTPLINTTYKNDIDAVAFVLEQGGNINALDERGGTAEAIARTLGRTDIADLLARYRIAKGLSVPASYEWVSDDGFDVYCIYIGVYAAPNLVKLVKAAFGIKPETEQLASASEMWKLPDLGDDGNDAVQIGQIGEAVIAYENNGWTGIDEAVIKEIAPTISVSLFRKGNAQTRFIYAKHGVILRSFDPVMYNPEGALAEETALNFRPVTDSPYSGAGNEARAFQLMEELTGVRLERDWLLKEKRPAYLRA